MNRTARDRAADHPQPVRRIELNEDKLRLRFILVVLLLALGVGVLVAGLMRLLTPDTGWQEIEASRGGYSVAPDFVLYYELGAAGGSVTAEKKQLSLTYTQAAADAYQIFNAHARFEGVGNLAYLSDHPNETVAVEPELYRALTELEAAGSRVLYLAPVYEMYYSLFHCQDLSETMDFDPYRNEDLAAWCREAAGFAADPAAVQVELLGEDRARLRVSEDYRAFLAEYGVTDILDFFWTRNAFVADFLADRLLAEGFTHGCLSSYDGFTRNLDGRGGSFDVTVFHRSGERTIPAADFRYQGPMSLVSLHSYPVGREQAEWYYEMPDGEFRHPYIDAADGLCKAGAPELLGYSRERRCGEVLLALLPVYVRESLDPGELPALRGQGIDTVFCEDGVVLYTQEGAVFDALYADDAVTYRAQRIG